MILDGRLLIAIMLGFLGFLFVPDSAFDSYRYYEDAESLYANLDLVDVISYCYNSFFDFIYYVLLSMVNKIGLPYSTVTGVFVGVFYYQTFLMAELAKNKFELTKDELSTFLATGFALISVSYIVIFAISRNLAGFAFLLVAINQFLKGHKIRGMFFVVATLFTHVGVAIYLIFVLLGYKLKDGLLERNRLRKRFLIGFTLVGMFSSFWMIYLMDLVSLLPVFSSYEGYSKYLTLNLANVIQAGLSLWDKLFFFSTALVMLYALYHTSTYNVLLKIAFVGYVWLAISLGFSFMFTQRTLMYLVPFQSIIVLSYYTYQRNKTTNTVFGLLLVFELLVFIINVYTYRDMWVFEIPS